MTKCKHVFKRQHIIWLKHHEVWTGHCQRADYLDQNTLLMFLLPFKSLQIVSTRSHRVTRDDKRTSWLIHLKQKRWASSVLETLSSQPPEPVLHGGIWLVVTSSDKDCTSVKIKLQCPDRVVLIWAEVWCQGLGSIYQFSSAASLCLSSLQLAIISMRLKA